jgi:hypothetical protein
MNETHDSPVKFCIDFLTVSCKECSKEGWSSDGCVKERCKTNSAIIRLVQLVEGNSYDQDM